MCMSKSLEELAKADKAYLKKLKYSSKKYNDKFRAKHAEKLNIKHECECGAFYSYYTKSKHLKTQKHKNGLIKNNIIEPVIQLVLND